MLLFHLIPNLLTLRPQKAQIHFGGEKQNESQLFIGLSKALVPREGPVPFL